MTDQRIAFICDRKKCKNCNPDCLHTTDINHAANFERTLAPDTWFESKPTVDAKPVRPGKWIDMDEQSYTWKVRCSVCGHERSMMSTQGEYPNYCENCGARMDEDNVE